MPVTDPSPSVKPQASTVEHFDVVIMGAGFAGLCQARHLLLNIPGVKIALIDPRPEDRAPTDLKIGESTVEVAAMFIQKDLGLYDYTIEHHPPKYGLSLHWAKDPSQTAATDDYFHIWYSQQPPIGSMQMNRATFERDLLRMNKDMGATYVNGRVTDFELTPGDAPKPVTVKLNGGGYRSLSATHLIDAAGRKFLIGKRTDNLIFDPEQLFGIDTGSAWVRVRNVDREIFDDGSIPHDTTCSHYYGTNHWFGDGHWLWMIPSTTEDRELSVGIVHHRSAIADNQIDTREKFFSFLQANHEVVYRLLSSGDLVDFHHWRRLAHTSKRLFSPDNWYVLGDAARMFDPFYSPGSTLVSLEIESVTEIVRAKLAGESNAASKVEAYNDVMLAYGRRVNQLYQDHANQLGNASIMSWRVYVEYIVWFGIIIPMFVGKWHLDLGFARQMTKTIHAFEEFWSHVYEQLGELAARNANIGLMDNFRSHQLWGRYRPAKPLDDFMENTKFEPKRCDVFLGVMFANLYTCAWYVRFLWRGFGPASVLSPRHLGFCLKLLQAALLGALGSGVFKLTRLGKPKSRQVAAMRAEFANYRYQDRLQPWSVPPAPRNA